MKKTLLLSILIALTSCVEEISITDFPASEYTIMVEGIVSDQEYNPITKTNPSQIHLTKTKHISEINTLNDNYELTKKFEPITDALVIISDNEGTIDTLTLSPDSTTITYTYPDTTYTHIVGSTYMGSDGYYTTTKLKGRQGNTYTLRIEWNGKVYTSTCTMPHMQPIDSIIYQYTQNEIKGNDYYVPHLYFKDDPNAENYYKFTGINGIANYTLLSDEFLSSDIKGLDIFKGIYREDYKTDQSYPLRGTPYAITMTAITREVYDFYNTILEQIKYDGGMYSPAPSSPPTNISNGAIGIFSAEATQYILNTMPDIQNLNNEW